MNRVLPLALAGLSFLSACQTADKGKNLPPPEPPRAFHAPLREGMPLRRVALLPLASESVAPESLRDIERAFTSELSKQGYFEVVPVSRTDLESIAGERQLLSVRRIPDDLLPRLRERYGADGVMFIDLTQYSAYRPVSMGVRAKLVDVESGRIHWSLDHVYDTGKPTVAQAAREFQQSDSNEHRALPDDGGSALISPARFARYVAAETFASMRPQRTAENTASLR